MPSAIRPKVLAAVRFFDLGARPEGRCIRLSDGSVLPNERRALEWVVATYHARAQPPRQAAEADPQLAVVLRRLEAGFGPVEVLQVRSSGAEGGVA